MSTSTRSILAAKPLMESGERLATAVLTRTAKRNPDHVREDWDCSPRLERFPPNCRRGPFGSIEDENSRFPINAIFYEREADRARAEHSPTSSPAAGRLMRVHGYAAAGQRPRACQRVRGFAPSMGRQTETDQDTLKWYLTQTPRYLPPDAPCWRPRKSSSCAASCRTEWDGCSARNEGTARPAGNPDHLDAGPMNMNTLQPAVLSALVRDERQARPFVNAVLHYRDNPDNDLGENWYKDLLSAYDVPALPNAASTYGAAGTGSISPYGRCAEKHAHFGGWVTHEYVTWNTGRTLTNAARSDTHTCADRGETWTTDTSGNGTTAVHPARTDDRHRHSGILEPSSPRNSWTSPTRPAWCRPRCRSKTCPRRSKNSISTTVLPVHGTGLEALVTRPPSQDAQELPANGYITKIPKTPGQRLRLHAPGKSAV